MATSKTGSFWLTETIQQPINHPADTPLTATIDLGAYVDVGDQQLQRWLEMVVAEFKSAI